MDNNLDLLQDDFDLINNLLLPSVNKSFIDGDLDGFKESIMLIYLTLFHEHEIVKEDSEIKQ